jgi:hypothetical protein
MSNIYHTSGEFGEFHPTALDSTEEISSKLFTTKPSTAQIPAEATGIVNLRRDLA